MHTIKINKHLGALPMIGWLYRLMAIACVVLLSGCKPADNHVLKLGANNWLGYQPFYSAQALGFYDSQQISVVELGSATEVMRALSNEAIDLAALTLDEVITVLQQKPNLKILMVIDYSYGGDALIAKPNIKTLSDLKNRTIAVENSALGSLMLDAVLTKANLQLSDVSVEPVTFERHEHSLVNGEVDAVITFEPVKSKLLASGYKSLFDSKEIPEKIVDVLVASEQAVNRYPERIKSLMAGFFSARKLIVNRNKAVVMDVAERVNLSREAVLMGFDQLKIPDLATNKVLMSQCDQGLQQTVNQLYTLMKEKGIVNRKIGIKKLCEPSLILGVTL